jgi:hypothetical protein
LIGGWNLLNVSLGTRIFILNSNGGQIIFDFHWFLKDEEAMDWRERFPQLPLDKENKFKKRSLKAWGRGCLGSFSCVIFLGKERRKMMSFSRWWKKGEWAGCLGYFERIKLSRIMLGV